jgi:hypothetical protein
MRTHVSMYIRKCPCCQKMSVLKPSIHTIKYSLSTYTPMDRICIDTINLNKPDVYGNQHIIVMIDAFTRWVELYPAPDLTALSAARALLSLIGRFGVRSAFR